MPTLEELLGGTAPNELELLKLFQQQLPAGTPEAGSFDLPDFASFRGEAEELVSPFFDKELDLLNRTLETSKKQLEEKKTIGERRVGEEETMFAGLEDVSFARALESAQQGFSGRGTFTSGFRRGAIQERTEDRTRGLEEAELQFGRAREDIDVDFRQFLERQDITREGEELGIERRQEAATLTDQRRLQQEDLLGQLSLKTQREDILSGVLNRSLQA